MLGVTALLPHEDLGAAWRKARPRPAGRHLDSAACSRQSHRALEAAAHHARHEAELGGYVAEATADDLLQQGRSVLGGLVGMAAADVAFVESAQAALVALLTGWRLPAGSRVACLPGEYAPNIAQLRTYGLRPEPLPVDGLGRAGRRRRRAAARRRPAVLRAPHAHPAATAGCSSPPREIAALCRAAGVPLVLDAAQSLGHADVDLGADVVYGTSRKWLAGPRGVGFLCVRPALAAQLTPVLPEPEGVPPMRAFESGEAHVAGRVGLVVAVGEHLAAGPGPGAGAAGRHRAAPPASCWTASAAGRSIEPVDEPTATTTLRPPDGVDVVGVRTPAADRARHRGQRDRPGAGARRDDRPGAAGLPAPGRRARRPRGPRRRPLAARSGEKAPRPDAGLHRAADTRRWTASCSSRPACTGTPSSTTSRPPTTVCRADTGPQRSHASTGSDSAPANADAVQRPHDQVAARADRQLADLAGPPEAGRAAAGGDLQGVARRHRARAVAQLALQHRRPGLQPQRRGVRRRRAVARPARPARPAARSSATGASPLPRIMLDDGQCAAPTPRGAQPGRPRPASGQTTCASQVRSVIQPTSAR